ncbi:MarR family EPS-associated transcriptional regulator [Candidatus Pelagibacter sp.]|nr:MarR family EPS-associated transcriptional regulator [Candidatus Pelagibacter sp.]
MSENLDYFEVLRKIENKPKSTQRELAQELGFSLGKLNYSLKALQNKGLVKIENFKKNPNKLNYLYALTPEGISEKTKLTINFMTKKMKEYDELKNELNQKNYSTTNNQNNITLSQKNNILNKSLDSTNNKKIEYGFQGRLSSKFPSQVMLDITEVCNLACIHCTHPIFKESSEYAKAFLSTELNKKMVDEVKEHGQGITKYIRYTSNGEPLVHPKSYEMLTYAVENSGTKVTLTTNGTLLKEKKMLKLLESGIHMIDVSIDAAKNKTYEKIRVNGDLDITKKNVIKLIELAEKAGGRTKILVSFVEQKDNSLEVESFRDFWKNAGASEVLIRKLHTNAGSNEDNHKQNLEKKGVVEKRFPCLYPWERIVLTAKGKLSYCPTDWFGKTNLVDFRKKSIREVWTGEEYQNLRNEHLTNKFKKNKFCEKCPDWKNTSWPQDDKKSYADLVEKVLYEA